MNWAATSLAVAWISLAPGWTTTAAAEREPTVLVEVAATVGDDVILDSDVRYWARAAKAGSTATVGAAAWKEALADLIERTLWLREARRLGVEITDQQIDDAIAQVRKQNALSLLQLEAALEEQGMSLVSYRRDIRDQLLVLRVSRLKGDAEARKAWLAEARERSHIDIRKEAP